MVEFIVQVFAVTVASIMIFSVVGAGILVFWRPSYEAGPLINSITDIMNTLIGALIGFVAGKGAMRMEENDRRRNDQPDEQKDDEQQPPKKEDDESP